MVFWSLPRSLSLFVKDFGYLNTLEHSAFVILLYSPVDRYFHEELIKNESSPSAGDLTHRMLNDLDVMDGFAVTRDCRIRYIKTALGMEDSPEQCGNCDNCRRSDAEISIKELNVDKVRTILRCVAETRENFGKNILTDILHGNETAGIRDYALTTVPSLGALQYESRTHITDFFESLLKNGYLKRTSGVYPTLYLSQIGKRMLGSVPVNPVKLPKRPELLAGETIDRALMEKVRNLRRKQAKYLNIPSFSLFSDAVLKRLVQTCPTTENQLMNVKGFGKKKWLLCGEDLLRVMRSFKAQ